MCETLEFNGRTFFDQTADWLAPQVTPALCDQAAANLGLPMTGTEASQKIVDLVPERGPLRGNDVVEALFGDYRPEGRADSTHPVSTAV